MYFYNWSNLEQICIYYPAAGNDVWCLYLNNSSESSPLSTWFLSVKTQDQPEPNKVLTRDLSAAARKETTELLSEGQ